MIKSPFNYIGGKAKLYPQIEKLLPEDLKDYNFYEIFGGGFTIGLNNLQNCKKMYYNELDSNMGKFFKWLKDTPKDEIFVKIDNVIKKYNLTKLNKDGFLKLREDFNNGDKSSQNFYCLHCYSFNNQIEYNKKGEFNSSFGKNRSSFNPSLRKKLEIVVDKIKEKEDIVFTGRSFDKLDLNPKENDFFYVDPPYLASGRTPYQKYWG